MPIVKMPNGDQVQFPDDMPKEQIRALIAQKFPDAEKKMSGPTISVGDRKIPIAEYQAMSDADRQAIQDQIAEANPDAPGMVRSSILDPFVQGTTFGFGDELRGLVQGGILAAQGGDFGKGYEASVSQARESLDKERRVNPVGSFAAELGGAMIPAITTGGATSAPTLGGRALQGLGLGALEGGLYGFGAGEGNVQERLPNAAAGAAMGGAVGVAAPYVGAGISKVARKVTGTAPTKAAKILNKALGEDAIPADQISAKLKALGPDSMIADLGPNLQSRAGAIAAQPGAGQKILREALDARMTDRSARVLGDIQNTLGSTKPAFSIAEDITQMQSQAAKPLYDAVRNVPVNPTGNLTFVMQTPMGKQAFAQASKMAANDGATSNGLTVGLIDYAKRALDDVASSAIRAGNNNQARQAATLAKLLVKETDNLVPAYAKAREAFAGPAAIKDALDIGTGIFNNKVHPAQLQQIMSGMTASERQALLQGAQSAVQDIMGTARNDALSIRTLFQKGYNAEKLRMLIGSQQADDLLKAIQREVTFGETANVVAGNSETMRRSASMAEVGGVQKKGMLKSVLNMNFGDAVSQAFDATIGKIGAAQRQATNEALAEILSGQSIPPNMMKQINRLQIGNTIPGVPEQFLRGSSVPLAGQAGR